MAREMAKLTGLMDVGMVLIEGRSNDETATHDTYQLLVYLKGHSKHFSEMSSHSNILSTYLCE